MILLVLNMIISIPLLFVSLTANNEGNRGTNAATRFVRDSGNNIAQSLLGFAAIPVTVLFLLIGALFDAPYACLPSALVIVLTFVIKAKSRNNEQRVTDARVVTKGAGEVAGSSSQAIGAAAGAAATAVGGAGAGKVAQMVGENAAKGFGAATASMDVPEYKADMTVVNDKSLAEAAARYQNAEVKDDVIIKAATNLGIKTDGKSTEELASKVVAFLPDASLKELPEGLTDSQKVSIIYGG